MEDEENVNCIQGTKNENRESYKNIKN